MFLRLADEAIDVCGERDLVEVPPNVTTVLLQHGGLVTKRLGVTEVVGVLGVAGDRPQRQLLDHRRQSTAAGGDPARVAAG